MVGNSVLLSRLCGLLDSLYKFEIKKTAKYIIWGLYAVLLAAVSYFHEPWFDEAQAWQIAKSASLYELFFVVPHYEGHPPLWHLVLFPFVKGGMPYEFSLSFVNIAFMAAGSFLIMFKTKLPDAAKITLPFTYFLFYQYGVISRPYSMMFLAFMLCAVNYREKNEKPVRMALSLAFMCLTSAYGLAIAGLICVVWLLEFKGQKGFGAFVKELVKSRVFVCMAGLLVLAALLVVMMLPYPDTHAVSEGRKADIVACNLFYTYLILPADATVGTALMNDDGLSEYNSFQLSNLAFVILSAVVYLWMWIMAKKKGKLLLLLPFAVMPVLYGVVFFGGHHIGITTLNLIFFVCVCSDSETVCEFRKYGSMAHYFTIAGAAVFAAVQIFWSASSAVMEINRCYASGKAMAEFIKENNIQDGYLLNNVEISKEKDGSYFHHINFSYTAVETLAYFDENIYDAFNRGDDRLMYNTHRTLRGEAYDDEYEYIKSVGIPDYVIGAPTFGDGYGEYMDYLYEDYRLVSVGDFEYGKIFKGQSITAYDIIYRVEEIPD